MTIEETIAAAVAAEVRPVLEELRALCSALRREAPAQTAALLTLEEVAERCGRVTTETVRTWIHAKRLNAQRVGNRYLVKPADLESFVALEATVENRTPIDSDTHLQMVTERMNRSRSK